MSKIESTNPNYEKRYWMRVFIVGKSLFFGWGRLWYYIPDLWDSFKDFIHNLGQILLLIIIPMTFIFAPFWLYILERDNKKMQLKIAAQHKRNVQMYKSTLSNSEVE